MILSVNRDYFLEQQQQIDVCNGGELVLFEVLTEFLNII
jgi:hypothetical protein